jgi:hypothetical protein
VHQERRRWAAISYPDQPTYVSAETVARRAKVRIGVKVALITLPFMLAAGFAAIAGGGSDDSSTATSAPLYSGDKIALAVRLAMQSHGLLDKSVSVDCDDSTAAEGAVSNCSEYATSGDGGTGVTFAVHFGDTHGHFSFVAPGGQLLEGKTLG